MHLQNNLLWGGLSISIIFFLEQITAFSEPKFSTVKKHRNKSFFKQGDGWGIWSKREHGSSSYNYFLF